MKSLALVCSVAFACAGLAACDRGDQDQNAIVVTNNDGTVQDMVLCQDGSTVPAGTACPVVVNDNHTHNSDAPVS